MKEGWKTTEFWVTVLALGGMILGLIGDRTTGTAAVVAGAIASGLYAVSRGLAKKDPTNAELRREVLEVLATDVEARPRD